MTSNVIVFGWNRPLPGREHISAAHFDDFVKYLSEQQRSTNIQSFDIVFLDPHGGDLNGFFLIKGNPEELDTLMSSKDWITHMTRASLHLDGAGAVRGGTGDAIGPRMELWKGLLPQS
ncbi:MAG TPA: hypothetical protein VEK56_11335 [Vicinamibacterales bacterium]|nr:hypothetical protein [Vicinamibacterales bacterium]